MPDVDDTQQTPVRVLIVVDSWMGHTAKVAERVAAGVGSQGGQALTRSADEATREDVRQADALIMGSAVHQRAMTWKMKRFVDEVCEPAWFHDDMVGRVGAVFTTGGGHGKAGGGAETAQLGMLANLAACGMVMVPLPKTTPGFEQAGVQWGPTIKTTDADMRPLEPDAMEAEAQQAFFHHGANVARVATRLRGVDLARGNRWPSAQDRAARIAAEVKHPTNERVPIRQIRPGSHERAAPAENPVNANRPRRYMMARSEDMAGKVALITGGGTGIGLRTALAFARAGGRVAIAGPSAADEALAQIRATGADAMQVVADVAKPEDVTRMVGEVVARWGRLDAAVNNAGIEGEHAKLADQRADTLNHVLQVNVQGVFLCMQAEIKQFEAQGGGGAIVNVASGFAFVGYPESSPYAASKGAVMGLTRSAALEYARSGIRINALCPMDIDTPMLAKGLSTLPGGADAYMKTRATGRLGKPEEVGAAAVFLCSQGASFVIGSALMVDGGYVAQ